jgi:nitronate monooxygenase
MFPMSCPALAVAVSRAGGLGFLTGGLDAAGLKKSLDETAALVKTCQPPLAVADDDTLPIGVGFLLFGNKLSEVLPLLRERVPAAVWLFAPQHMADYAVWTEAIREATRGRTKIWFQVGSAADALEVGETCEPDALVVQGAEAGGHGLQRSAGLISLFPEVADALQEAGLGHVPLFAAGGMADGRGCLAAMALGASGVVMGTRFLAAEEALIPKGYQDAIVAVKSGTAATVRTDLFDKLAGPNIWPVGYDGRAIINRTYVDAEGGMHLDALRNVYSGAFEGRFPKYPESGQAPVGSGHLTMWAGSGVGLVNQVMPAAEIVEQTRKQVCESLEQIRASCHA